VAQKMTFVLRRICSAKVRHGTALRAPLGPAVSMQETRSSTHIFGDPEVAAGSRPALDARLVRKYAPAQDHHAKCDCCSACEGGFAK